MISFAVFLRMSRRGAHSARILALRLFDVGSTKCRRACEASLAKQPQDLRNERCATTARQIQLGGEQNHENASH